MTKPSVAIIDIESGETIVREMNDEEYAQHQIDVADNDKRAKEEADKIAVRSELLSRLGINEDEAKLLLG